ncbi:cell division protein FtsA [Rhodobacter sp. NTK016B]|uniref:cell division protein FtsA n=1 Tax=Rhodobacter sp. NTK016B TaxID=2759676 RepID=UPI001A90BD56|nr:cell division protein FtsA [Rhodobacter sp. NTK016B]MBN8290394.1 cell division protein FtsA [Rhodobacter sp. NTK016B]
MTVFYDSQRAQRNLRQQAMQRGVIAVMDVGSHKVACLILKFGVSEGPREGSGVGNMAGQAAFRVIGAGTTCSRGVRFGEIAAMRETERAVRTALQNAQKMAQTRVDHAILTFSGGDMRSYGLEGAVELEGDRVSESDIARVLDSCILPDIGHDREALHAQPVNFVLDHRTGLADPRGQSGRMLGCDMHMLSVSADVVQNLVHCLKRCDVEVAGLAAAPYVAGRAALVEDEQELGAAVIDMGGGTTTLSIFIKGHMIYADSVRLGGEHITSDIAIALQVPSSTAERIKTFHGGLVATRQDDRQHIEIGGDSGDWDKDRRTVTRSALISIMRPRVEEILEEVRARLDVAGFDHLPSQQIVLTGGGSQIPGLDRLAAKILGPQVRLGRPIRVPGLPQAATGPEYAAIVGLCQYAAHPQDEWWDFDMPAQAFASRPLKRAMRWFRDNW